jgi:glycosyltransferase involved in cell wall biosynthesis
MKLSIITPVYNAEKTIEKTILSVIQQKREWQLEYIVVDGSSKDRTLEIIRQYSDHIDIIISEKDQGVYDAMNKGIQKATGDVIGIINSDDWYNENAFLVVEQAFEYYPHTEILYAPVDNYFDGQYLNTFQPGSLENLNFKFTINHPSCFVRRSVYSRIGLFDLAYAIAADYDFIFRAYSNGVVFHLIEIPLVSYSLNGMSGKPLSKFKQIWESWRVGAKLAHQTSYSLVNQRRIFYLNWFLKELFIFPIKQVVKPQTTRKIKSFIRQRLGKLPSDQYGAW